MKHLTAVRGGGEVGGLAYASCVCNMRCKIPLRLFTGLAVLLLASVFPEKAANQVLFFLSPFHRWSRLQLSFRTCRFSAVRCLPSFLSLLKATFVLASSSLGENKHVAAPEANSFTAICLLEVEPPPLPPPYKQGCICFFVGLGH